MCTDAHGAPTWPSDGSVIGRARVATHRAAGRTRSGGRPSSGEVGVQLINARGGRIELNLVDLLLHRGELREALIARSPLATLLDQGFERIGHAAELTAVAVTLYDLHLGLRRAGVDALMVIVQPGRIGCVRLCGASPKVVHQLRIQAAGSMPAHGHPQLVDSVPIVLPLRGAQVERGYLHSGPRCRCRSTSARL